MFSVSNLATKSIEKTKPFFQAISDKVHEFVP